MQVFHKHHFASKRASPLFLRSKPESLGFFLSRSLFLPALNSVANSCRLCASRRLSWFSLALLLLYPVPSPPPTRPNVELVAVPPIPVIIPAACHAAFFLMHRFDAGLSGLRSLISSLPATGCTAHCTTRHLTVLVIRLPPVFPISLLITPSVPV